MFQLELEVLRTLSPATVDGSETSFLIAFDMNRSAILEAARAAYLKKRGSFHRLSAINFD